MKMRRFLQWGGLIAVFILILGGCAGEKAPAAEIKAADVNMTTCLPSFLGAESICLSPTFRIRNPNDFIVGVELSYSLNSGGSTVGTSQIAMVYVPPGGTVEVRDAIVVPFFAWLTMEALSGKGLKEALTVVAPLWKGLGGKRPAAVPEALWDTPPTEKTALEADVSIIVSSGAVQKLFPVKLQWQEPE
jgi:hypothetical protein